MRLPPEILAVVLGAAITVLPFPESRQSGGGARWRATLLTAREAVWRDYFANPDRLAAGLTPDFIAMNDGGPPWQSKEQVVEGSRASLSGGTALVHLAFPKTEIQRYGEVAIIYTTYELQLSRQGRAGPLEKGQATELFRWDGTRWLHTGWHLADIPPQRPPGAGGLR